MKKNFALGRVAAFLIVAMMLMSMMFAVSVSAEENTTGDGLVYEISDNGVTITGYTGDAVNITIPEKIDGKSVTAIGDFAFSECYSVKSVTIPKGIESIGYCAFSYCSSIESINIPEGVNSIGKGAFEACSSLTEIKVDKNNTYFDSRDNCNAIIVTDSNRLIAGCINTVIPEGIESIGEYAFSSSALESITLPASLKSIGEDAFSWCESLKSITIPASVENIDSFAFNCCTSLAEINVNKNNAVYDSRDNCNAIIKTASNTLIIGCMNTVIPEGIESIGEYAFSGSALESITLPASLKSIGEYAFSECFSLESIIIPESVNSIEEYAFSWCESLESISIPESVESISEGVLYACSSLKSIAVPESVKSIGNSAFGWCESLESLTLPEGVRRVGEGAFYCCAALESVTVPESVKSIGNFAFDNCDILSDIYYGGTQEQWDKMMYDYLNSDSDEITAIVHSDTNDTDEDNNIIIFAVIVGGAVLLAGVGICVTIIVVNKKKSANIIPQNIVPQCTDPVQPVTPVQSVANSDNE